MSALTEEMSDMAGSFTFRQSQVTVGAGASGVALCPANPLRWAVMFSVPVVGGAAVTVANVTTNANDGPGLGQSISQGSGYSTNFRQHGTLPCQAWFGGNPGGGGTAINVIEVVAVQ